MENDKIAEFVKQHKGYDDIQALRASYQVKIFIRSIIYMILIGIILWFAGLIKECAILFLTYKFYRANAGGIHIKGYIKCFISSLFIIAFTILLTKLIPLNLVLELILIVYVLLIWFFLVPQGTSQRPIRRTEEKRKMKTTMLVLILLTVTIRFLNTYIYSLALWSLVITLTLITPLVYRILKVRHDRM
jgi:accessory gene regulator protein AgrB